MEVEIAWLETPSAADEAGTPQAKRKKPPRLPGANRTLPPMPVLPSTASLRAAASPRHPTMEVEMNWLELLEERTGERAAREAEGASTKQTSSRPKGAASTRPPTTRAESRRPTAEASRPNAKPKKPIPRED